MNQNNAKRHGSIQVAKTLIIIRANTRYSSSLLLYFACNSSGMGADLVRKSNWA